MDSLCNRLDKAIRRVPDFPKKGILFYDVTSILADGALFHDLISGICQTISPYKPDAIAAIEARGFIFASAVCDRMSLPLIPVRKKGKLPGEVVCCKYNLEYGVAEIEIHKADIPKDKHVLVMDDLVATGGTLKAACELLSSNGALVSDIFCVIGLPFLNYRTVLNNYRITTLLDYDSE